MRIVDLEGSVSGAEVRALLAFDGLDTAFDLNHLFASAQARRSYAGELLSPENPEYCALLHPVSIGLIDGSVDADVAGREGIRLSAHSVLDPRDAPATSDHATGIATLIASEAQGDGPAGFARGAQILSAVAVAERDGANVVSTENLAEAMDWLVGRRAAVVNMSLAGPFNRSLQRVLSDASIRGTILVAASGNDARRQVAYPGSDPNVIAVTAVDARLRVFRDANTGAQVEFAAPGVDLLVTESGGPVYRTGTSYAAAIASALIAHDVGSGSPDLNQIRKTLSARSVDIGEPGFDETFGWGLVRPRACEAP